MNTQDHVDTLSASLVERERPHVANHLRSIQVQTLDALLRIEELLTKLVAAKANDAAKVSATELKPAPRKGRQL
jgi:hypothetical protein